MGNLLRRSWNNRNGSSPDQWEKPVNQASKWLVARSGSQRLAAEGGSFSISNNQDRKFVFSVFVGDGGLATINGSSGKNSLQISRSGSVVTMKVQPDTGGATTKTTNTEMPNDRWANVYIQCVPSGILNNQITMTYQTDFNEGTEILSTGDFLGNLFRTNGSTMVCNSLAGWTWFADQKKGFFGWGSSNTIPIEDSKYREAVTNNGTWDVDNGTDLHTWYRPEGVRFMRAWLIQGGGGSGGDGYDGQNGRDGNGPQPSGCTFGERGGDGGPGGPGGNDGDRGDSGSGGEPGWAPTFERDNMNGGTPISCSNGSGGRGGGGGRGGDGGRGVMIQMNVVQDSMRLQAGKAGGRGNPGGRGGDGGHTRFGDMNSVSAMPFSNGRSPSKLVFGKTTFTHGVGGSDQSGGVVFYYQW